MEFRCYVFTILSFCATIIIDNQESIALEVFKELQTFRYSNLVVSNEPVNLKILIT